MLVLQAKRRGEGYYSLIAFKRRLDLNCPTYSDYSIPY
jgi:hypothetical protein